ncbi:MAG: Eco57I restriction-modification methylase domain-containing protein [Planctomycetota bacterium]
MPTPQQIQQAIQKVADQRSFINVLLRQALGWEIPEGIGDVEEIAYAWSEEDLQAEGLDQEVVEGQVWQIQPLNSEAGQLWGIFVLEFKNERPFVTSRGLTSSLRKVLRGLVPNRRNRQANLPAWNRDNLLFICTYEYKHFRFAYFKAPKTKERNAPLALFGWNHQDRDVRTLCEHNLPYMRWDPDALDFDHWREAFSIEKVTKDFYLEYAKVFEIVETIIGEVNPISGNDLRLYTQMLFNRLMFLRFIEKKGWLRFEERTDYLATLYSAGGDSGQSFYRSRLCPLFFEALAIEGRQISEAVGEVVFLNGGLFEKTELDNRVEDIPDTAFENILGQDGLFYRFNFTVEESTPLDIEVAVDPEMLGKVFEELVTGRHETGSYYTPRSIVSFMCREVLKGYLKEKTSASNEAIDKLVDEHEIAQVLTDKHADEILFYLETIRAVDPACGSGAYLLGLLQELINIRKTLQNPLLQSDPDFLYKLKLALISGCLYGVDIDPFATNIAKLRLWLSLTVEAETAQPLPNLDFKIETGDSVLGPCDAFAQTDDALVMSVLRTRAQRMVLEKDQYMMAHGDAKKVLFEHIKQEEIAIAEETETFVGKGVIAWHVHFAEVFGSGRRTQTIERGMLHSKDLKVTTYDPSGFDIVLANPPYISAIEFRRRYTDEYRKALNARFRTARGAYDVYVLFFERALQMLAPGGWLSFITPNKYLAANYAKALREFLVNRTSLSQVVDLSRIPVFESASVYPVLTFIEKRTSRDYAVRLRLPTSTGQLEFDPATYRVVELPSRILTLLPNNIWGFLLSPEVDLLEQIMESSIPLGQLADVCATTTAAEADDYGEHLTEDVSDSAFRVVNTGTIDPYRPQWGENSLTHQGRHYRQPYLPRSVISQRRARIYSSPKLVFAKIARRCEAILDEAGQYAALNANCLYAPSCGVSLEYFAGFCHSQLFHFLYTQFFGALRMSGGYFQFQAPQIRIIPMRLPDNTTRQQVSELVRSICLLLEDGHGYNDEQVRTAQDNINSALYRFYELSDDDIDRVESIG